MGIRGRSLSPSSEIPHSNIQSKLLWGNKDDIPDLQSFIESKGIEIKYKKLDATTSGCLTYENDKWIITVNEAHSTTRQRFTLAHELAHFLLHADKGSKRNFEDTIFFRSNAVNQDEIEANSFAANLLMPEDIVKKRIKIGITSLVELAASFGVSPLAMEYRLNELGYKVV